MAISSKIYLTKNTTNPKDLQLILNSDTTQLLQLWFGLFNFFKQLQIYLRDVKTHIEFWKQLHNDAHSRARTTNPKDLQLILNSDTTQLLQLWFGLFNFFKQLQIYLRRENTH